MEKLKRFPFILVAVIYLGYVAYGLYNFHFAADGEVEQHKVQLAASQKDIQDLKTKLNEGQKFLKSLDAKKAELQLQIKKLAEYQGALSEAPDVASIIKLLSTEAKKVDVRVDKIEPGKRNPKPFYLEQEFKISLRGGFHQIALFCQRVSELQRILRVEAYNLKVSTVPGQRAGTLEADLSVRAYQYTPSQEDQITVGGKT